ncbi:MAG TPA: hypothetical protein PLV42_06945 [bacterium]|nr:hypothetical protein [bacterium]
MGADLSMFSDILRQFGVAALLFIVVWWMFKQQTQTFTRMMDDQKEQSCAERKLYEKMIEQLQKQEERSYNILNGLLETTQYHAGILARVEQKIDSNEYCPLVRGKKAP